MATYEFTRHIDGAVPSFDPSFDVLRFPAGYGATGLTLTADGSDTLVWHGGQSVRLPGVSLSALDGTQFSFEDGSVFRRGSGASETFAGTSQGDQFDLSTGGFDRAAAGDGNDLFRFGSSSITRQHRIDGGAGADDELHLAGTDGWAEWSFSDGISGIERFVFGTGGRILLELRETVFSSTNHAVSFDTSAQGEADSLYLASNLVTTSFSVVAGSGSDTLQGGSGDDSLIGGAGWDLLFGGSGSNTLDGGDGADRLWGGRGADSITGGAGNDTLYGGGSDARRVRDTLSGGDGDDWLYSDGVWLVNSPVTPARLTGGAGADTFVLYEHGDWLNLLQDTTSLVMQPARITDFNLAEGDRLFSGINDGRNGAALVVWYGAAPELFTATNGQDLVLPGADTNDKRFIGFWTAYDAVADRTILYVDRNGDFRAGSYDLKIFFDGNLALSPEMFSEGTFIAKVGTFGADADSIQGLSETADLAFGLAGDDTLAGLGGDDTLNGDGGADQLSGGAGSDNVYGGAGDDSLTGDEEVDVLYGGLGADTLWGGDGSDYLDAAAFPDSLPYSPPFVPEEDSAANVLHGGTGNDRLRGAAGGDHLFGEEDDDELAALAGDDTLDGGDGDDLLEGGAGNDSLVGGAGNDTLRGSGYQDQPGTETLEGGDGDDSLYSAGPAVMSGGSGADLFSFQANFYNGVWGAGISSVAQPGRVTDFNAGDGDRIETSVTAGAASNLTLVWRGAADAGFTATEGQSLALAGAHASDFRHLEFWTAYDEEADKTILYMDSNRDFVVDGGDMKILFDGQVALSPEIFPAGTNFARRGTDAADDTNTLAPTLLSDVLIGAGGADTLRGGAGNDTLDGGTGADVLGGNDGDDRLVAGAQDDSLHGGHGQDTLYGGHGSDTLRGGAGNDFLNGEAGADELHGGEGADTLMGGAGDDSYFIRDTSDITFELGGEGYDRELTTLADHTLGSNVEGGVVLSDAGGRLAGNTLSNHLTGDIGNDSLDGGFGSDTLVGGGGSDTLRGGDGADRFVFERAQESRNAARDLVVDFTRGVDRIDLGALDADATAVGQQHFTFIGSASFGADATGQLRFALEGDTLVLYGSTDADAAAEFAVQVMGTTRLSASDLIL